MKSDRGQFGLLGSTLTTWPPDDRNESDRSQLGLPGSTLTTWLHDDRNEKWLGSIWFAWFNFDYLNSEWPKWKVIEVNFACLIQLWLLDSMMTEMKSDWGQFGLLGSTLTTWPPDDRNEKWSESIWLDRALALLDFRVTEMKVIVVNLIHLVQLWLLDSMMTEMKSDRSQFS